MQMETETPDKKEETEKQPRQDDDTLFATRHRRSGCEDFAAVQDTLFEVSERERIALRRHTEERKNFFSDPFNLSLSHPGTQTFLHI